MDRESGAAVVIVGGGVTGLSAGWWLARSGVDVLVIDKGIVPTPPPPGVCTSPQGGLNDG
jgi:glycine/D-amino acid oxidase-like deaminating enzyme